METIDKLRKILGNGEVVISPMQYGDIRIHTVGADLTIGTDYSDSVDGEETYVDLDDYDEEDLLDLLERVADKLPQKSKLHTITIVASDMWGNGSSSMSFCVTPNIKEKIEEFEENLQYRKYELHCSDYYYAVNGVELEMPIWVDEVLENLQVTI